MSNVLEVYQSIEEGPIDDLKCVLQEVSESRVLNEKDCDQLSPLLRSVSAFLGRSVTRLRGLLVLRALLSSCPASGSPGASALLEQAPAWIPLVTHCLKNPAQQPLAYNVLKSLLEYCSAVHELEKSSITSTFGDIFNSFSKCHPAARKPALSCLLVLLNKYSKASGGFKNQIEKFLIPSLETRDSTESVRAAKCVHLLQQVRGGGESGVNHKMAWRSQLDLLLSASHKLTQQIYSCSRDSAAAGNISYFPNNNDNVEVTVKKGEFVGPLTSALNNICCEAPLLVRRKADDGEEDAGSDDDEAEASSTVSRAIQLSTRLNTLLVCIQAMLVEPFPVAKRIRCEAILELLLRLQATTSAGRAGLDAAAAQAQTHNLMMAAVQTLQALVVCLQGNIFPHAVLCMRLLLQCLQWTKPDTETQHKPYRQLRTVCYKTLSLLFSVCKAMKPPAQPTDQALEDAMVKHIMADVLPHKNIVQLQVTAGMGGRHMSKKARKKTTMAQLEASNLRGNKTSASSLGHSIVQPGDRELTMAGLQCLETFLHTFGLFMKPTTHKMLIESMCSVLLVDEASSDMTLRLSLHRALLLLHTSSSHTLPSTDSLSILVFSRGQTSNDTQLSSFCMGALSHCLGRLHGQTPPLVFPRAPTQQETDIHSVGNTEDVDNLPDSLRNGDVIDLEDSDKETSEPQEKNPNSVVPDDQQNGRFVVSKRKRESIISTPEVTSERMTRKKSRLAASQNKEGGQELEPEEILESDREETETIDVDEQSNDVVYVEDQQESTVTENRQQVEEEIEKNPVLRLNREDPAEIEDVQTVTTYITGIEELVIEENEDDRPLVIDTAANDDKPNTDDTANECPLSQSSVSLREDVNGAMEALEMDQQMSENVVKNGGVDLNFTNNFVEEKIADKSADDLNVVVVENIKLTEGLEQPGCEGKVPSMEEMMSSFVDEVVEEFK